MRFLMVDIETVFSRGIPGCVIGSSSCRGLLNNIHCEIWNIYTAQSQMEFDMQKLTYHS